MVFATGNSGKLREAQEILGRGFSLVTPAEAGITQEIPETGNTLAANSLQKAEYIHNQLGTDCFADDTALEVEILGGDPGVHTARYASEGHDPQANMAKLLREMALQEMEASLAREYGIHTVHATRKARFRTVVTLILDGETHVFEGVLEGRIGLEKKGDGGFGYDPVFIPDSLPAEDGTLVPNTERLTLAQTGETDKNAISHRGKALRAMAAFLNGK